MIERLKIKLNRILKQSPWMRNLIIHLFLNSVTRKISGKENIITYKGSILRSVTFDIKGNGNNIEIEEGCRLSDLTFYIRGDGHTITIGKGCQFIQGGSLWFEDCNGSLIIGQKSTFYKVLIGVLEPRSKVIIGQDCMLSRNIEIRTGDSHSILSKESGERINFAEDVYIGNHVWIGTHNLILKGVYIPDGCVVAAGSVVTGKFEKSGVIIGGNPARIIREEIMWQREQIYKTSNK